VAVLLDALDGMVISDDERASQAWLAGLAHTGRKPPAMITHALADPVAEVSDLPTTGDLAESSR
jgi:hypothetical protein